jgi:hypothetical protein
MPSSGAQQHARQRFTAITSIAVVVRANFDVIDRQHIQ